MRICALFLLVLMLADSAQAQDAKRETLDSQGSRRSYYLFVPKSVAEAKPARPAPLLILLHGSGRNGLSLVDKWKDLASREGIILAGPDAMNSQAWRTPDDGPDFLHDLVEKLKTKQPIDPSRVYLFGHSGGAVFGLGMAMMESTYFASVAVHAGAWRDKEEFAIIDYATRKIPIEIFVGDRDQFFPLKDVEATRSALNAKGFRVDVSVIKGHDHNYYDMAGDINRDAWEFLKGQTLSNPKYAEYGRSKGGGSKVSVEEINALLTKVNGLLDRFFAKEDELAKIDLNKDRASGAAVGQAQVAILNEAGAALRDVAAKAEQMSKSKSGDSNAAYFSTLAKQGSKRAEMVDAMRERSELLTSSSLTEEILVKRAELRDKIERLRSEADELGSKKQ